jgi:spermidine/putrescine-binding protein
MKRISVALILLVSLVLAACSPASTTQTPASGTAISTQPAAAMTTSVPVTGSGSQTAPGKVTSKELNLYAWSEYIPPQLLADFTKEYGVKVNYDTYSSNEELMAKLQAGASGYDVIVPSDYTVAIMIKQGLLEPLDLSQIPNLTNVADNFRNPDYDPGNKYTVPYQWGTVGLVVNTQKVTRPLTSWNDLWDPSFKSRVVLLDDEREDLGMTLLTLGYDKNSIDPKQLNDAKTKMQQLLPNVKLFDSDSPKTALLSGEVWLGQTWNGEAALAHQQNPAIDYICPKEGCGIWFDNLAIPKGAPHQDAAMAFLNFILRPDESILITKAFPYSNPNKAALDLLKTKEPDTYQAYMNFRATNPSADDIKNAHSVKDVGDATTLWDQVWTEIKGK